MKIGLLIEIVVYLKDLISWASEIERINRITENEQQRIKLRTYLLRILDWNPLPKDDLCTIN